MDIEEREGEEEEEEEEEKGKKKVIQLYIYPITYLRRGNFG